mgnify:CR=1 FL=1
MDLGLWAHLRSPEGRFFQTSFCTSSRSEISGQEIKIKPPQIDLSSRLSGLVRTRCVPAKIGLFLGFGDLRETDRPGQVLGRFLVKILDHRLGKVGFGQKRDQNPGILAGLAPDLGRCCVLLLLQMLLFNQQQFSPVWGLFLGILCVILGLLNRSFWGFCGKLEQQSRSQTRELPQIPLNGDLGSTMVLDH